VEREKRRENDRKEKILQKVIDVKKLVSKKRRELCND